jgi:hypothetical protein
VDIEVNDPSRDIIGISEMAFHPREHSWLLSQPDTAKLSAFYFLWSAREARYKLLCNLRRDKGCAPIVGGRSALIAGGHCWRGYQLQGDNLTVVLFSDRKLLTVRQKTLSGFSHDGWLAAEELPCRVSKASKGRAVDLESLMSVLFDPPQKQNVLVLKAAGFDFPVRKLRGHVRLPAFYAEVVSDDTGAGF